MKPIKITAFDLAQRFVGMKEVPGVVDNPQIIAMLRLDASWPEHDEVAWCSSLPNYVNHLLRLPRSKSLRARSWLQVGIPVELDMAEVGFDVVILSRGGGTQPGPEVIEAPGHVGYFAGWGSDPGYDRRHVIGDVGAEVPGDTILVLGGNQGGSVSIASYGANRILGVRRTRGAA